MVQFFSGSIVWSKKYRAINYYFGKAILLRTLYLIITCKDFWFDFVGLRIYVYSLAEQILREENVVS